MLWGPRENAQFNSLYGPLSVLSEGPARARVRFTPQPLLTSISGAMHGGAIAGFIDIALFAGLRGCGVEQGGFASTIDLSIQYAAPGSGDEPMDAFVELTRETRRMVFLRGTVEQSFGTVAAFMATIRKGSAAPPQA